MLVALAAVPAWAQAAYPAYQAGTAYKAGDIVSNAGALYECKEFPYSGWCGASPYHYEPGVGAVWADAWKLYGGEVPPPALVVAIGSPAVGSSVSEGASVALAVTLNGPATALAKVEYLVDGTLVATATASPWSASWSAAGVRIPVKLNSDSGICEHHFRKVCGQGFFEQKLSFEGRHLFDSPNKPAAKRSAAVVDPGHWSMTVHLTSEFVL